MKIVAILALFLASAVAQYGLPTTPYSYVFIVGQNTQLNFGATNNQSAQITQVAFSVAPQDNEVYVSYPSGATKGTIGIVNPGSTGSGSFYAVGTMGNHYATVTVSYKKGVSTYSFSTVVQFAIVDSTGTSNGKREIEEVEYYPADTAADVAVTQALDARGVDVTFSPLAFQVPASTTTWVSLSITTGSTALRNVSFAVAPSSNTVFINYAATGNNLGNIPANSVRSASFSITAPQGAYTLYLAAQYKKGVSNSWVYEYDEATLNTYTMGTSAAKRSDLDIDVQEKAAVDASAVTLQNADGSINIQTAVGLGAGVAFVALVAVGAAVFVARKRNAIPTLTL